MHEKHIEKAIENKIENCCSGKRKHHNYHSCSKGGDGVYFFGFIGAAIFFIGQATTFWAGVLGFLKAIIWPIYFVYEALKFLIQ